mmetsp:Transcript_30486/g.44548  ORF Transcript_30486/g.44548 Transcript_30486/m.44548 type:complete len:100 (-) Transcript_30486:23-322(-)
MKKEALVLAAHMTTDRPALLCPAVTVLPASGLASSKPPPKHVVFDAIDLHNLHIAERGASTDLLAASVFMLGTVVEQVLDFAAHVPCAHKLESISVCFC